MTLKHNAPDKVCAKDSDFNTSTFSRQCCSYSSGRSEGRCDGCDVEHLGENEKHIWEERSSLRQKLIFIMNQTKHELAAPSDIVDTVWNPNRWVKDPIIYWDVMKKLATLPHKGYASLGSIMEDYHCSRSVTYHSYYLRECVFLSRCDRKLARPSIEDGACNQRHVWTCVACLETSDNWAQRAQV